MVDEAENRRRNEEIIFEDQKVAVVVLVEYLVKHKDIMAEYLQKRRFRDGVIKLQYSHFLRQ